MPLDWAALGSTIGALGIGSVLGQWLAGSKDRRSARASALYFVSWERYETTDEGGIDVELAEIVRDAARLLRGLFTGPRGHRVIGN